MKTQLQRPSGRPTQARSLFAGWSRPELCLECSGRTGRQGCLSCLLHSSPVLWVPDSIPHMGVPISPGPGPTLGPC